MALFNYATKEITLKIVYYGPGLSGKTTNLQHLHLVLNPETKGKLLSLSTESDRTLFFDFLPVELGKIREFSIRFQLYTVPGQVRYNATRKVVLKGADGVVFVADSQKEMQDQNIESFDNMRENLVSNNINPDAIPVILQYNKRDLKNILSIEELNQDLNKGGNYEVLEASAVSGMGVEDTFKRITKLLLKDISRKHKIEIQPAESKKEPPALAKPLEEPVPGPIKRDIMPDLKPTVIDIPASSGEPVSESDAYAFTEEDLEILPDHESEDIEVLAEAELMETPYEPELVHGWEHAGVADEKSGMPEPLLEDPAASIPAAPMAEIMPTVPESKELSLEFPLIEEPQRTELPPFPIDKIEDLSDELARVSGTLSRITDAIAALQKSVSELKGNVVSISSEMALTKEKTEKEPELKEIKEFKELRREQKEMLNLLRDVSDLFSSIKEKKSWFKL